MYFKEIRLLCCIHPVRHLNSPSALLSNAQDLQWLYKKLDNIMFEVSLLELHIQYSIKVWSCKEPTKATAIQSKAEGELE